MSRGLAEEFQSGRGSGMEIEVGGADGVKANRERGSIWARLFEVRHMTVTLPLCSFFVSSPLSLRNYLDSAVYTLDYSSYSERRFRQNFHLQGPVQYSQRPSALCGTPHACVLCVQAVPAESRHTARAAQECLQARGDKKVRTVTCHGSREDQ